MADILDGMSGRYPRWIKDNIAKIATYIITTDDHSYIESLIEEALHELESGKVSPEDLVFAKLSKEPEEYKNENDRMRVLANMSGKQKGETVSWYETLSGSSNKSTYSIKSDILNLDKYKTILLNKLRDILELTGQLLYPKTIPITRFGGRTFD